MGIRGFADRMVIDVYQGMDIYMLIRGGDEHVPRENTFFSMFENTFFSMFENTFFSMFANTFFSMFEWEDSGRKRREKDRRE